MVLSSLPYTTTEIYDFVSYPVTMNLLVLCLYSTKILKDSFWGNISVILIGCTSFMILQLFQKYAETIMNSNNVSGPLSHQGPNNFVHISLVDFVTYVINYEGRLSSILLQIITKYPEFILNLFSEDNTKRHYITTYALVISLIIWVYCAPRRSIGYLISYAILVQMYEVFSGIYDQKIEPYY